MEPLPADQPPRRIGPYRLLARLGAGGMGEVHLACRADDPTADPHRMVAVKTVREDLDLDDGFRARFRREIDAARAVRSPYAAAVAGGEADAETPWLATAYVPGPSLAEAVDRAGPLPLPAVRALGRDLARALHAIHSAQVLHRDLKPGNVLLAADGPRVIDFGIAQALDATALTSTGLVVGTPGFMSPEHLTGSRALVPASDVFCLGALLCFAATGRGPFDEEEMGAVVYRISRADAELDAVPEALREVIGECLRREPGSRPSAEELIGRFADPDDPEGEGDRDTAGADGTDGPFPWPGGVLSLIAEHGDAARRCAEAAAGAAVADLPTRGPAVPYSPTAVSAVPAPPGTSVPPVPPAPPGGDGFTARRRTVRIAAGTVAAVLVAVLGAVALPRLLDGAGGDGPDRAQAGGTGGTGEGDGGTTAAGKPVRVLPDGGPGRARDFGDEVTARSARPEGWSPWRAQAAEGTGPCGFHRTLLVCSGFGGGVSVLRADDGEVLWEHPGDAQANTTAAPASVVGDTVHVSGPSGLTGYRLADGKRVWRAAPPEGGYAAKGAQTVGDVRYTVYLGPDENADGLVVARRLDGDREELWRTPVDGIPEAPAVADGRIYLLTSGGGLTALSTRTGEVTAQARDATAAACYQPVAGGGRVLCAGQTEGGVAVLDGATLKRVSTVAPEVRAAAEPVLTGGRLLVLADEQRLYGYDLRTGKRRWAVANTAEPGAQPYLAGDRLLVSNGSAVHAYKVAPDGSGAEGAGRKTYQGYQGEDYARPELLSLGGVVFLSFPDGTVLSGYAP